MSPAADLPPLPLIWSLSLQFSQADRPNILWITIEDWSSDLSCYGTKGIHTPHVDKLASEGIRYERAFTTSPVCSTSRSAMMTGFHQNYIGAHHHRTDEKKPLPYGIRPIPHLLADAAANAGEHFRLPGQLQQLPALLSVSACLPRRG